MTVLRSPLRSPIRNAIYGVVNGKFGTAAVINIALVTADTTHASATNNKSALELFGHTVTLIDDANIGATDFSSYDVVVAVRVTSSATVADATVTSGLRALLDAGKPLVVGPLGQSMTTGTGRQSLGNTLKLTGTWRIIANTAGLTDIVISDNSHPITSGLTEAALTVYDAANFRGFVWASGGASVGTPLALGVGDGALDTALLAIEDGTLDNDGASINARVVVSDIPHASQSGYTSSGDTLLNRMVLWAAGRI